MARKFRKGKGRSAEGVPAMRNCGKCGRGENIHAHHIIARADGGGDAPDNLIDLCSACHAEWHAVEKVVTIRFDEWIVAPPYAALYASWLNHPHKGTIDMVTSMQRVLRSLDAIKPGPVAA